MINVESFGSELPKNWEEIARYLNDVAEEMGFETAAEYNELWEQYWSGALRGAPEAITE